MRTNLTGANFTNADLSYAHITDVKLKDANFTNTDLAGAYLFNINLAGVDLIGVNLAGANLSHADLTDAKLFDVNLKDTNLDGAKLTSTYFVNVENITSNQLKSSCNWQRAIYKVQNNGEKDNFIIDKSTNKEYIEKLKESLENHIDAI